MAFRRKVNCLPNCCFTLRDSVCQYIRIKEYKLLINWCMTISIPFRATIPEVQHIDICGLKLKTCIQVFSSLKKQSAHCGPLTHFEAAVRPMGDPANCHIWLLVTLKRAFFRSS